MLYTLSIHLYGISAFLDFLVSMALKQSCLPSISRIWPRLSITYYLAPVFLALSRQSPVDPSIFEEPLWTLTLNSRNTTHFWFQPAHSHLHPKNTHTCSCLSPPPTATSMHTPRHAPIKWWQLLVVEIHTIDGNTGDRTLVACILNWSFLMTYNKIWKTLKSNVTRLLCARLHLTVPKFKEVLLWYSYF